MFISKRSNRTTISDALSDNETNSTIPACPNPSSGEHNPDPINKNENNGVTELLAETRELVTDAEITDTSYKTKSKNFILNLLRNNEVSDSHQNDSISDEEHNDSATSSNNTKIRGPALKREKSHTDSIERKKKRVKFSILSDEVIPNVDFIANLKCEQNIVIDNSQLENTFSTKLKKLLSRTNKKTSKPTSDTASLPSDEGISTSTDDLEKDKELSDVTTCESIFVNDSESNRLSNCDTTVLNEPNNFTDIDFIDENADNLNCDESINSNNETVYELCDSTKNCNISNNKISVIEDQCNQDYTNQAPKREGTFTLDGSPPPKIVKSNDDDKQTMLKCNEPEINKNKNNENILNNGEEIEPLSHNSKKNVAFYIQSESDTQGMQSQNCLVERKGSILKRQRPTSFVDDSLIIHTGETKDETPSPSPPSTISSSSETIQSCLPKTSVSNIGSSAKRSLTTAWRNTMTRQDSIELKKDQTINEGNKMKNNNPQSKTVKPKENLVSKKKYSKDDCPQKETPETNKSNACHWGNDTSASKLLRKDKSSKVPTTKSKSTDCLEDSNSSKESKPENQEVQRRVKSKSSSIVARASSWSGMALSVPHVRRDNTFMKIDAKKYDSEKERLQNEVAKLSVEKDRLSGEVADLKTKVEEEVASRKAQKRNYELRLRQQREDDTKKHDLQICDLKNRLEEDKRETLSQQKECLTRTYETEMLRNNRGRDEETRRLLSEARVTVERLQTSLRREALKETQQTTWQHQGTGRELEKLTRELTMVKDQKKKLEETMQRLQSAERARVSEIRRIHEQHEANLTKILKTNKQEATRLLDEIKSKDRAIGALEKRLNHQDAKIRQQEEKQRDANKDESGRKLSSRNSTSSVSSNKGYRSPQQREDSLVDIAVTKDGTSAGKETPTLPNTTSTSTQSDEVETGQLDEASTHWEAMKIHSVEEIDKLKKIVEEQQHQISSLIQQAIERDNPDHLQLQVWPHKRESCMKASDLPTVLEQAETSSSRDTYDRLRVPAAVQPFRRCVSLLAPNSNYRGNSNPSPPIDWAREQRLKNLETTNATLEADLQEARDHAELLEFRILEYTEGIDKGCESNVATVDQATSTSEEFQPQSPLSLPLPHDDLSLPLSIDSGLDLSSDTKARITEGKGWISQLSKLAVQTTDKAAASSLVSLLEWLSALPSIPLSPIQHGTPTPMSPTAKSLSRMVAEDHVMFTGGDLTLLAARLQETLTDPAAQETALVDTIAKLRMLDSSLGGLQSRVNSLTEENKELQDALTALSEAHETRTEASGTESEIVHRKTPSIHSDLSDAESDPDPHHHSSSRHNKILSTTTSFQESGIFDASCDFVNAATQTKSMELSPIMLTDVGCFSDDASSGCGSGTEDVDLKSAVARLATIRSAVQDRDLRSIRLQDLQESDEYLKSALEGERVSISKLEYDSIVATERQQQHRLEILKADRDDLSHRCQSLQEQLTQSNRRVSSDSEEMLRGEFNVLSQRLEVSERCRRELFEEKCELEEAENDARLMVQRLEGQLDAAREMESLLSASLSQEQQLSREMQRKFRDVQHMEKDRRAREEVLEQIGRESSDKLAALTEAKDILSSQLSFAAYGLLLAQMWKKMDDNHTPKALVPCSAYSALTVTPFNSLCDTNVLNDRLQINYSKDMDVSAPVQRRCSTCIHNNQNVVLLDKEIQAFEEESRIAMDELQKTEELSLRRSLNNDDEESAPAKKKLKSTVTRSTSTMTHLDELLSDREKYYLEQIEGLQKEKMSLRKGQEVERSDSLQHYTDLEDELRDLKIKLEESEKDKCNLIFRLEEIEDSRDLARKDMQKQFDELKCDMNRNNNLYDMEKAALQRGYESRLQEVLEDRSRQETRARELELKLSTLRQELEAFGGAIANDLVELDTGDSSDSKMKDISKNGQISPHIFKAGNDGELLDKIRGLIKSESSLRQKIGELEKKESAYRETIEEADTIMSSHVTSYTHRIEELEGVIEQHVAKIKQLETSEERLRGALRTNCRTSEGERITELLDRVIETENSELKLKERVWSLERIEKELQIKLVQGEKTNQSLRSELRDQEELVQRLMSLQTENNLLSVELQQAHDSVRKLSDVQQSESYFRSRVEELESTENTLRESLHQADILIVQRERKLKEHIRLLEEELHSSRTQHENSSVKALEARETEIQLRKHLDELRSRLQESEKELKESSSENINHETQHRSELTKLRNHLKLVNNQLTELDGLNCVLRDRVSATESEKETVTSQLDERIRRHEQDVLSLNLQITTRDSKVEELEGQLQQLRHSTAAGELDALSGSPLSGIHTALTQLTTTIQGCEICSRSQSDNLLDITNQLGTLSDLIEGHGSASDSEATELTNSDLDATFDMEENTNTAENLVSDDTLSTAPPSLAKEGVMDPLSEELSKSGNDSTQQGPLNRRDSCRRSRRRIDEKSRRRLQMPSTTGSVLDELEEKVRELEEVIATKDEELKIADSEAAELNSKLQAKDDALLKKAVESDRLNTTLSSLREQLMCTIEDYERSRLSLETKHKVDVEEVARRMERLTEEVERLISRGRLKDSIIATLVSQIRALLRSGNMSIVINQLQKLSKDSTAKSESIDCPTVPEEESSGPGNNHVDFDIEKVCILLNQPYQELE